MFRHELIEVLTARPFRPFRMYVTDGAAFVIRHPDLVLVTPTSAVVGAPEGEQRGPAVERFTIVDLEHITRLEQLDAFRTPQSQSA
jgi:hypothetical protein